MSFILLKWGSLATKMWFRIKQLRNFITNVYTGIQPRVTLVDRGILTFISELGESSLTKGMTTM